MFKTLKEFYRSKEWQAFREVVISKRINNRGEIICEHCGRPIYKKYDCILHHKQELTAATVNNLNVSLNEENIMVIHFECHNEIHGKFNSSKQEVYIVWGSPCAGKSEWVSTVAKRDDIVIDTDTIYHMINPLNQMHDKPPRLSRVALKVRDTLLDCVRDRIGQWQRAYILTTECLPTQLDRMAEMYNAKLIHIDTDKRTCVSNLHQNELKYIHRDEFTKYIDSYWEKFDAPRTSQN